MSVHYARMPLAPPAPCRVDWTPRAPHEWFDGNTRTEQSFGGDAGFVTGPRLSEAERRRIGEIVHRRLVYNAYNLHGSKAAELVERAPLPHYHTVADSLNHGKMLTKTGRILPASDTAEIMGMSIFEVFRQAFGDFTLADEDNIGHPQVCMRVARPGKVEDVGFLHRDSWFWDHYAWPVPEGRNRTKVWIGLEVEPERNGLTMVPGSHRERYGFKAYTVGNKVKFEPTFDTSVMPYATFPGRAGECVVFNYDTLHIGRLNTAATSRVSVEFTIMY